jgi:hypothetical protein
MKPMKHLTLEQLSSKRDNLMKFSTINEQDIQKVWRQNSEKEYDNEELKELKYSWDLPLFCKIIFRLRQEGCCTGLFRGLDPGNQSILLRYFGLSWEEGHPLVEFLHWTRYSLGPYDICILEFGEYNEQLIKKCSYVEKWRTNEITFFFFVLNEQQREKLIKRYNKDSVDRYNDLVSSNRNFE